MEMLISNFWYYIYKNSFHMLQHLMIRMYR